MPYSHKGKVNLAGIRSFFEGTLFTTVLRTAQRKRVMPKYARHAGRCEEVVGTGRE